MEPSLYLHTVQYSIGSAPAPRFFNLEVGFGSLLTNVMWFFLNNKTKQHWLYNFTLFLFISTIIHTNTLNSLWKKAQCHKTKLKRKISQYLRKTQYFVGLSLLISLLYVGRIQYQGSGGFVCVGFDNSTVEWIVINVNLVWLYLLC